MKILVVGYGSIGKRHVQNLSKIKNIDILICTKQIHKKSQFNYKSFSSLRESIKEKPDAAIICSTTNNHVKDATILANAGIHLLIEKPLSNSLTGTKNLLQISQRKKLVTLIGCNFRFHPCIMAIKELITKNKIGKILSTTVEHGSYLPDWHPGENYKKSYAARTDLGGGVLLTSIHEIDYLYWFFGKVQEIFSITDKFSNLGISADDLSSSILQFKNKVIAEVHLDYFQQPRSRTCKIIGTKGVIYWNFNDNAVKLYKKNKWTQFLKLKNYDYNKMYLDELNHFIDCICRKKQTINPLIDGIQLLKIVLAAKHSTKTKKMVSIK